MRLARSVTTNNINETPASLRAAGDRSTALTQRHRRLACRLSRGTAPLARSPARPALMKMLDRCRRRGRRRCRCCCWPYGHRGVQGTAEYGDGYGSRKCKPSADYCVFFD